MRTPKTTAVVLSLILVAFAAGASEVALTRGGTLHRVDLGEEGLVLTTRTADGTEVQNLVPQTTDAIIESAQLGIDEKTQTPFIMWQQGEPGATQVLIASFQDGTWDGPTAIAGNDGSIATNPEMLINRETTTVTEMAETDEGSEEVTITLNKTFVHLVWWNQVDGEDVGIAMYAAFPVTADGRLDFAGQTRIEMIDLLPYGIGCSDITDASPLTHPKLFLDPATGAVNAMAVDFTNCIFQVVELIYQVEDWESVEKRGRHSVIFGRTTMIAINPDLPLGDAEIKVGRDLSLVMYWDGEQTVEYTSVDEDGWSEVKSLAFGEGTGLDHEQAVQLIQALAN